LMVGKHRLLILNHSWATATLFRIKETKNQEM